MTYRAKTATLGKWYFSAVVHSSEWFRVGGMVGGVRKPRFFRLSTTLTIGFHTVLLDIGRMQ